MVDLEGYRRQIGSFTTSKGRRKCHHCLSQWRGEPKFFHLSIVSKSKKKVRKNNHRAPVALGPRSTVLQFSTPLALSSRKFHRATEAGSVKVGIGWVKGLLEPRLRWKSLLIYLKLLFFLIFLENLKIFLLIFYSRHDRVGPQAGHLGAISVLFPKKDQKNSQEKITRNQRFTHSGSYILYSFRFPMVWGKDVYYPLRRQYFPFYKVLLKLSTPFTYVMPIKWFGILKMKASLYYRNKVKLRQSIKRWVPMTIMTSMTDANYSRAKTFNVQLN